jgi:hypothetical protein
MRWEKMNVHAFILRTINILIWRKDHYKIWLRTVLAPNTSTSLQTTLAGLAERHYLLEEQTSNKANSLMYRAGTRTPTVSNNNSNNNGESNTYWGCTINRVVQPPATILSSSHLFSQLRARYRPGCIYIMVQFEIWKHLALLRQLSYVKAQKVNTASRPALGPTHPPIKWVPVALSLEVKWPGSEDDQSPPSSAEAKGGGATPPLPYSSSRRGA